jgi:hypothetical protein
MVLDRPSQQPFPITKGRYDVRPGMREFGRAAFGMPAEYGHFRLDETTPRYLREKLEVRRRHPSSALQTDERAEVASLAELIWRTFEVAAEEEPTWVRWAPERTEFLMLGLSVERQSDRFELTLWESELSELGALIHAQCALHDGAARWMELLGLVFPCDFAVMATAAQNGLPNDRCEALHICFPSSWSPRLKIGRDFAEIHRPVANNEAILKGHANLVHAMCFMGPYVRFAWGLHRNPDLDSHPEHGHGRPDFSGMSPEAVAAKTWLRVERQTTKPFADLGRGLFTIRTYIEPLVDVAKDPAKAEHLALAIRSMNAASLRYKGMLDRRDALLAYLES